MAGGTWIAQNKVRPGAYINFEAEIPQTVSIGSRGIATVAMELDWGDEDKLIELSAAELLNGDSLAKIGITFEDEQSKIPSLILQNAALLKIFRINKGGTKATVTKSNLTVTAKYAGLFGNKIAIVVSKYNETLFLVETYANGYLVDSQKAATIEELEPNAYVDFSGTGAISTMESTLLTGGDNGTAEETTAYDTYFELLKVTKWNTLAVPSSDETVISDVVAFITEQREEEGKYVQAVIPYNEEREFEVDYEGIIVNVNGVVMNEKEISPVEFTAWVAGATAGADITDSNTGKIVENATSIIGLLSSSEIATGITNGLFLLSLNQDGSVKVEKDINSLHTFKEKSYIFTKNRVIRELDEIGSEIENIWEKTYLGKVTNSEDGRTLFKSSIISYLTELQNIGAISEFDSNNVVVEAGSDIDSVLASIAVKPLDSMEFLYMTVNINQ